MSLCVVVTLYLANDGATYSNKTDREVNGLAGFVHTLVYKDSRYEQTYTYDRNGNLTELVSDSVETDSGGEWYYKLVYKRDSQDRRILETIYRKDGSIVLRRAYSYDVIGNRTAEVSTSIDGMLNDVIFFIYDQRGNILEELFTDKHGSMRKYVYAYDDRGNKTKATRFKNGAKEDETLYSYDLRGRLVRSSWRKADSTTEHIITNKYDEKGTLIEEKVQLPTGTVIARTSYSYEYDAVGNWISRKVSEWKTVDGQMTLRGTHVHQRTITYY